MASGERAVGFKDLVHVCRKGVHNCILICYHAKTLMVLQAVRKREGRLGRKGIAGLPPLVQQDASCCFDCTSEDVYQR